MGAKTHFFQNLLGGPFGNAGDDPALDPEDRVQVAEPWEWPDAFAGTSLTTLREVQRRVKEQPRRCDPRSDDWIGYQIIEVLGLDMTKDAGKARATKMFETWKENGMVVKMEDDQRKMRPFVVVDKEENN
jgi:hypothetical protein